jgi:hypothetical protein
MKNIERRRSVRRWKQPREKGCKPYRTEEEENSCQCIACRSKVKKRFEYFTSWDPDVLIHTRIEDKPLVHSRQSTDLRKQRQLSGSRF